MIGQYLLNTNEIDTIHILQNILELNKALVTNSSTRLTSAQERVSRVGQASLVLIF